MPPIMTGPELSARLGIPRDELMRLARLDRIPSIKTGGRRYFNASAVIEAIRERQQDTARPRAEAVAL